MRRLLPLFALFGLLVACSSDPGGNNADASPWTLEPDADDATADTAADTATDTGVDTGIDTGTDTSLPDIHDCSGEIQKRDGTCDDRCPMTDPDCAACPDPDDPNIDYVGDTYEDPTQCQLIDYTCPDGWNHFHERLCGCGCRKDTSSCPDPDDPDVNYVSEDPDECARIFFDCEESEDPFNNQCGCGCVADEEDCEGQDAEAEGACRAIIGVKFDGERCTTMSGCRCEGSDCDDLYESQWTCADDNADCVEEPPCSSHPEVREQNGGGGGGGSADAGGTPCRIQYAWNGRTCVGFCMGGSRCDPDTQSCYGIYDNQSRCEEAHNHCNRPGGSVCDPMDAKGEGLCDAVLGYKYDGNECLLVGGCECTGSDCDELYRSREECRKNTSHCGM